MYIHFLLTILQSQLNSLYKANCLIGEGLGIIYDQYRA